MNASLIGRILWMMLVLCGGVASAAESLNALSMVTPDAALCLEIPRLDQSWNQIESSALMQRLRSVPAFKRLLESPGYQHWQEIEEKVAAHTGRKISAQLRALFGNSLVLAIYIPERGEPKGILMGEALDAAAVETALATWNTIDPNSTVTVKTVQGSKYHHRRKQGADAENLFYVSTDRWFAISDQEALIQDVIQRFMAFSKSGNRTSAIPSLREVSQFQKNRLRLKSDAAAYLYINARPWDRGLEEACRDDHGPINPAQIWKHVRSVSGSLDLRSGMIGEALIEIESGNQPGGWSQIVATGSGEPAWDRRVPSDALMAMSGHLEIAAFLNQLLSMAARDDQAELAKNRRMLQSLFGGQELFGVILPTLAKDFCGTVALRSGDSSKKCPLDASVSFTVNSPGDSRMLQDIARGLETGLSLLAAYFSADGQGVVTVRHEQNESSQLSWLSETAPISVAYGVRQQTLAIAASPERLRKILDLAGSTVTASRLTEHAQRYFPQANQLIWLDAALVRQSLGKNGRELARLFARGSELEEQRFLNRFEQVQPYLGVVDSLFVAGKIETDVIRVTIGGGMDATTGRR